MTTRLYYFNHYDLDEAEPTCKFDPEAEVNHNLLRTPNTL